jgi:hypothetical protein
MRHGQIRNVLLAGSLIGFVLGATQAFDASGTNAALPVNEPFAVYLTQPTTKASPEKILSIARSEAARDDEANPTITVSKGSFEDAMRSVDPSTVIPEGEAGQRAMYATPVSLVAMQGSFTLQNAKVPHGAPAPKGSVLDLIINEHTGSIMGRILPSPSELAAQMPLNASTATAKPSGTIVGKAQIGGGPHRPGRPSVYPAAHVKIQVLSLSPVRVVAARTTADAGGQFRVRVRPGRFLLTGTVSPSIKCRTTHSVLVRPGSIVGVRLGCPIK